MIVEYVSRMDKPAMRKYNSRSTISLTRRIIHAISNKSERIIREHKDYRHQHFDWLQRAISPHSAQTRPTFRINPNFCPHASVNTDGYMQAPQHINLSSSDKKQRAQGRISGVCTNPRAQDKGALFVFDLDAPTRFRFYSYRRSRHAGLPLYYTSIDRRISRLHDYFLPRIDPVSERAPGSKLETSNRGRRLRGFLSYIGLHARVGRNEGIN